MAPNSPNKRASMREGPLAALFRKTEEGEEVEKEAPHPALSTSAPESPAAAAPEEEPQEVPSPKERLRNVFSSEIPENIMERPQARVQEPASRQVPVEMPPREEPRPYSTADQVIHPVIRVVGVGGAGVNAVNRMVEAEVAGVEFMAINTDLQSLQQSTADITLHIGAELTRGLGSGADANVGRQAAMDDYDRVKSLLKGSDMIFITAGAGGGTGTGAAPIVARIAREIGALTVAIVTRPFGFEGARRAEAAAPGVTRPYGVEGTRRREAAEHGVGALAEEFDTLIVVPNERLLSVLDKQT